LTSPQSYGREDTSVGEAAVTQAEAEQAAAQKAAIAAAFDNSAATYEQVGVDYFAPLGAELARRAALQPGAAVLDLGCGRGHVLFPVAAAVGPGGRVVGTDLSPRMVQACAAQAAAAGLSQVSVMVGDAAAPDFPAGSFDVVTAGMVMFFVPAPRDAMRAVARVLRPGGRFAMSSFGPSDPKFAEAMGILYRHREGPPWEEATDKPFDHPETIAAMLTEAGYVEVEVAETAQSIRFSDVEQYWAWVGSHGGRILIDAVGPDRLPAAKEEVFAMLTRRQVEEGGLVHRATARFALARVPG
jgi:ubiquinone/menaquinone biosynthesis C-methylase UbiE